LDRKDVVGEEKQWTGKRKRGEFKKNYYHTKQTLREMNDSADSAFNFQVY
jgi:hypothetical protein